MQEAHFYTKHNGDKVKCDLCPWNCMLKNGQAGSCNVRVHINGQLFTQVYNKVAAFGIDPIEKKPLYHFHPGKNILSIGEVGCNLHCNFCQNYRISQCFADEFSGFQEITSQQLVAKALKTPQNIGIAYTYNEPFTFYEFMIETAKLAHQNQLKNVVVSNGYVNPEPLQEILPFIDAFNVDLKAFTEKFYQKQTKGKLGPVLNVLKIIAASPAHLEITNLIIPGLNDDEAGFEEMSKWIATELGRNVPLHLSRYFPQYKLNLPPTPVDKLESLYNIAKKHLFHVYLGNVNYEDHSSTTCPNCGEILISRKWHKTSTQNLAKNGSCFNCGATENISVIL